MQKLRMCEISTASVFVDSVKLRVPEHDLVKNKKLPFDVTQRVRLCSGNNLA